MTVRLFCRERVKHMKKLYRFALCAILAAAFCLSAAAFAAPPHVHGHRPPPPPPPRRDAVYVYAMPHGESFHRRDCKFVRHLRGLRRMTIREARRRGYRPCRTCM